jgi:outer membrane autotransporter protein
LNMKTNAKMERRDGRNLRHQSAVGLLLLALLVANPLQGFSQSGVINTPSTIGTNLNLGFSSPTNFVTVTNGVLINNSTSGSNAVFGNTYFWNLTNAATLNGNTNGVYMNAGGNVNNLTNGIITGGVNGVYLTGGTNSLVSVINAGSITGTNHDGVYLGTNGNVNNLTNGIITGGVNGVEIAGTGSVVNAGLIISTNVGVYLGGGGSVNNLTNGTFTGTITGGQYGVEIAGGAGSVTNNGFISGGIHGGVYMTAGGNVNNLTNGIIAGGANGVNVTGGTSSVVNAGSIIGTNNAGVSMNATVTNGSVNNLTGGKISGGLYGVYMTSGTTGSVVNAGMITGYTNAGVYLGGGGTVNNLTNGIITGGQSGVFIAGGTGSVTNNGLISGNSLHDGVYMTAGGSVNNQTTNGIITGSANGVEITGGAGTVINSGTIIGTNLAGVNLGAGGSVNNQTGGIIIGIAGGSSGVYIDGGAGYVTNAGTIISTNGTAILLGNYSNTVVLQTNAVVQGNIVAGAAGTNAAFLQGHGSYGNSFSNFQTLTVQGDSWTNGGWTLTGTNTFSTNTTVQTGLLRINGGLTSPLVTVSNGANLGGAGTITGTVTNYGHISPGNSNYSIGKLSIVGTLNMMSNSIYDEQVNIASSNSSLISVTGAAIISNATVSVRLTQQGIYSSNTVYTNLTATGGVYGTNASVSLNAATPNLFLTPSLQYLTNTLGTTNTTVTLTLHRKSFTTVADTYNQNSVAGALYGIVDLHGAMTNLVTQFFWLPSAAAAQKALDSMSGEIHGSLGMLDVQQQDAFNNSIALRTGRMSAGGESGGYAAAKPVQLASAGSTLPPMQQQSRADQLLDNVWLQGFGTFGHLDGDGNASGGDFTISGLSGGFDYRLSPEVLVGLAVGYSHDDASVGGPGASGSVDAIQFAGYSGYVNGPWHLDGIFSYGYLQTDTKRFINVGSISQEADGSYDGNVFSLSTEGGYAFAAGPVTIEPTVGLKYAHLSQDSFQETGTASDGNNYGLSVHSVDMDSLRSALGVRLAAQFGKTNGVQFIPALRAAWEHEFMDKTADVNASFIGGSGDFVVRGVELGADSGVLGAGLTVAFNKALQGFVNYDANLNTRLTSHSISGGLSYSW